MTRLALALLLGLTAAPALGNVDLQTYAYSCERGARIEAAYVNAPEGASAAVITVEGRLVALPIAISASGARYAGPEEVPGYVWWTKGDAAALYWHDPGMEKDLALYQACKVAE